MNKRTSVPARALAAIALICGFLIVIVVVAGSLGDDEEGGGDGGSPATRTSGRGGQGEDAPKSYVVQSGDTLTSIVRKTGVSVAEIEALNPGVDPQILVPGEKLKLR